MPNNRRSRTSKYDPIYALGVGEYFFVPRAESGADKTGDPKIDGMIRAQAATSMVPTTEGNLASALCKHTRQTGQKYKIEPVTVTDYVHVEGMSERMRVPKPKLKVTRMPDTWEPTRRRTGDSPATARVRAWKETQDTRLAGAWEWWTVNRIDDLLVASRSDDASVASLALDALRDHAQDSKHLMKLVRDAKALIPSVVHEAIYKLENMRKKGSSEYAVTLPAATMRLIHPERDKLLPILQAQFERIRPDFPVSVLERVKRVGGVNWPVVSAIDNQRMQELDARSERLHAEQADALQQALEEAPPRNRFSAGVPYNYLWHHDFIWVKPFRHPLNPGEQARVCFQRQISPSEKPMRMDEARTMVERANERWAKFADMHPDLCPQAPEYAIVCRLPDSSRSIFVLERINRNSDGGYAGVTLKWDISKPYDMPVPAGKIAVVSCGSFNPYGVWEPCAGLAELSEPLNVLRKHDVLVGVSFANQGAGAYVIDHRLGDIGEDIDLKSLQPGYESGQRSQNPEGTTDNPPDGVNLSELLGADPHP